MKNIPLLGAESARNSLSGIRHHNNRDAWIVGSLSNNGHQYVSYLIDESGIVPTPVISSSHISPAVGSAFGRFGEIKISRDGTKMIYTTASAVELSNFNCATGEITPLFSFKSSMAPGGLVNYSELPEFSIDSKYLYIMSRTIMPGGGARYFYFQYDATLEDSLLFMQSEVLIGTDTTMGCLQLAPDGKIYCSRHNEGSLSVIHNPSEYGAACGFDSAGFDLNGLPGTNKCYEGLPHYLERYKAYIHYQGGRCSHDSIQFSGDIWPPADTIRWNFGDPASGVLNISYDTTPSHVYSTRIGILQILPRSFGHRHPMEQSKPGRMG